MAARGINEQDTEPVDYEAINAAKNEQKFAKSLNIPDLFIGGFAALGGWAILNFIYTEVAKYINELGQ